MGGQGSISFTPAFSRRRPMTATAERRTGEVVHAAMPKAVSRRAEALMCSFRPMRLLDDIWAGYHLQFHARANSITLFKLYAAQDRTLREWTRIPLAQFRYDSLQKLWTLHYADGSCGWHSYSSALRLSD
jgi:hypothetical protein